MSCDFSELPLFGNNLNLSLSLCIWEHEFLKKKKRSKPTRFLSSTSHIITIYVEWRCSGNLSNYEILISTDRLVVG